MIINNEKLFFFVHIQKTAGTSISEVLFKIKNTKSLNYSHSFINSVNENDYNDYFKFCFVRNPFERLVSWYEMFINKGIHNDFSEYILKNSNNFSEFLDLTNIIYEKNISEYVSQPYPKSISFNQLDYISNNGKILVDFIGRFETINSDFDFIMNKIGITDYNLPYLNKFNCGNYRRYYSDKDIEKVYNLYKKDIDFFDYKF